MWQQGKEILGSNHRDTLATVHNLAVLFEKQNKLDEAESLYQRELKGYEETLGPKHPDTLKTQTYLLSCKFFATLGRQQSQAEHVGILKQGTAVYIHSLTKNTPDCSLLV